METDERAPSGAAEAAVLRDYLACLIEESPVPTFTEQTVKIIASLAPLSKYLRLLSG